MSPISSGLKYCLGNEVYNYNIHVHDLILHNSAMLVKSSLVLSLATFVPWNWLHSLFCTVAKSCKGRTGYKAKQQVLSR